MAAGNGPAGSGRALFGRALFGRALGLEPGARAAPAGPNGAAISPWTEGAARQSIAQAVRCPPEAVVWADVVALHGARGCVVETPWAAVVVGRTARQAARWAEAYAGRSAGKGRWLLDALEAEYAHDLTGWVPPLRVPSATASLPDAARAFATWALEHRRSASHAWPAAPGILAVGSWRSWRDAVLLWMVADDHVQLRGAAWAVDAWRARAALAREREAIRADAVDG